MTVTSDLLDSLEKLASSESSTLDCRGWSVGRLEEEGTIVWKEIRRGLNRPTLKFKTARLLARKVSDLAKISQALGDYHKTLESESLGAQILYRVQAPNRDECRSRSSSRFYQIGEQFRVLRDRKSAAIDLTNGALAVLEMHNPTAEQLAAAKAMCEKTIRMRKKNSVDFAYGQVNLSLAEIKCISMFRDNDRVAKYEDILKGLDRARRVFDRFEDGSSEKVLAYHYCVLDCLISWLGWEVVQARDVLYGECVPNIVVPFIPSGLSARKFVSALASNSLTVGFSETPSWVPSDEDIVQNALGRIPQFRERIAKTVQYCSSGESGLYRLELKLFELQSMLNSADGPPVPPMRALNEAWEHGEIELYFIHASSLIQYSICRTSVGDQYLGTMLRRLLECLVIFRSTWSRHDGSRLLSRQPVTFRFAACLLGDLGDWQSAFKILDYSRGLDASGTWSAVPISDNDTPESVCWVHVTHSPTASYVIMRTPTGYKGKRFADIPGKSLVPMFFDFTKDEMFINSSLDRTARSDVMNAIEQMVEPLCDWISSSTSLDVVLVPSGLYQAFPIWSCGSLGADLISGARSISMSPSRAIALWSSKKPGNDSISALVAEGSSVAGLGYLELAEREASLVGEKLGGSFDVEVQRSSSSGLLDGYSFRQIVHFTGHSLAADNPRDSALATYTGLVSVDDILKNPASAVLAVLGSCESGRVSNLLDQNELLSVQTALYYAGVKSVVGTSWSITDKAGFAFALKFYDHLASSWCSGDDSGNWRVISSAFASALRWMKSATEADFLSLTQETSHDGGVSLSSSKAFSFIDWGAFGLVGVDPGKLR